MNKRYDYKYKRPKLLACQYLGCYEKFNCPKSLEHHEMTHGVNKNNRANIDINVLCNQSPIFEEWEIEEKKQDQMMQQIAAQTFVERSIESEDVQKDQEEKQSGLDSVAVNVVNQMNFHECPRNGYRCNYCDFSTIWRQNLSRHLKTHTRQKDYICDVCGKGFIQRSNLTVHKRIHTGLVFVLFVFCIYL